MPRDNLQGHLQRRQSSRRWSSKPITTKQLSYLYAALATRNINRRLFPAAGALYTTELFGLLHNVKDPVLNNHIVYYNVDNHSLSVVDELHEFDYERLMNIKIETTMPAVTLIICIAAYRATNKYGERGGRFALIETGHAMQNLSLRISQQKLAGVQVGGIMDSEIKSLLGIQRYDIHPVIGYAIGHPAKI